MGAYNILITDITCSYCNTSHEVKVQFKYGLTWQLDFRIGERIQWETRYDIGTPGTEKVKVYGIRESDPVCPHCGHPEDEEYDIIVEKDIIKSMSPMKNPQDYLNDDEGCFVIIS
ncbi:hypothetical protein SAMN05428949_0614 [Chitinophaga sp. YR627]|uniref:hypothetical protein n=1 Tax=Chitinophaga sp. YR627 TaxID=1881041 RepID=UPI0008E3D8A9|nr:hypothetical protein [Chitinophaga sp. YR627]SFM73717.1 hypothetical protein SAMN05428949_0614 [Chitinophaga sp. YR627]